MKEISDLLLDDRIEFSYDYKSEILPILLEPLSRTVHSCDNNYLPTKKNVFILLLVKKGKLVFNFPEKSHLSLTLSDDETLLILPNARFSYKLLSEDVELKAIYFGITYLESYLTKRGTENLFLNLTLSDLFTLFSFSMGRLLPDKAAYTLSQKAKDLGLSSLINSIFYEFSQKNFMFNYLLHSYSYQLLAIITRSLYDDCQKNKLVLQGKVDELIEIAKKYIINNYKEPLNMEEIASQVYLSQGYFSKLFKNYVGISPYSFLVQIRLSKACELLEREEIKLSSIAKSVGFGTSQRMNTIFKKILGETPIKYRMNCKKRIRG